MYVIFVAWSSSLSRVNVPKSCICHIALPTVPDFTLIIIFLSLLLSHCLFLVSYTLLLSIYTTAITLFMYSSIFLLNNRSGDQLFKTPVFTSARGENRTVKEHIKVYYLIIYSVIPLVLDHRHGKYIHLVLRWYNKDN